MKKVTLFLSALVLTIGAMAQNAEPYNFMPSCARGSQGLNMTVYTAQEDETSFVTGTNAYEDSAYAQFMAFQNPMKVVGMYVYMGNGNENSTVNAAPWFRLYDVSFENVLAEGTYHTSDISTQTYTQMVFPTPATTEAFWAAIAVPTYTAATKNATPWHFIYHTPDGCSNDFTNPNDPNDTIHLTRSYSLTQQGGYNWFDVAPYWNMEGIALYIYPVVEVGDDVSVAQVDLDNMSTVYPSVATERVTVASGAGLEQVDIISMNGQVVYSEKASGIQHQVNVSGFAAGNYVVRMKTRGGITTKHLIVK